MIDKKNKTIINNFNLGEVFRYFNINKIFKWLFIITVIGTLLSGLFSPVKFYTDIECDTGDLDINIKQIRDNNLDLLKTEYLDFKGIKNMKCKGKIRIEAPLILAIFT